MNRGAWWAPVHGVEKCWTQLKPAARTRAHTYTHTHTHTHTCTCTHAHACTHTHTRTHTHTLRVALPGGSVVKKPPVMQELQRCGVDPWVRKIPWTRKWQPAPVFLPRQSHAGYSPPGLQRARQDWMTTHTCPSLGGLDAAGGHPTTWWGGCFTPAWSMDSPSPSQPW